MKNYQWRFYLVSGTGLPSKTVKIEVQDDADYFVAESNKIPAADDKQLTAADTKKIKQLTADDTEKVEPTVDGSQKPKADDNSKQFPKKKLPAYISLRPVKSIHNTVVVIDDEEDNSGKG